MASTATTSGGWSTTPSPYLGASGNTSSSVGTVGDDGNLTQSGADVGSQLGQALSAYHLHQTANNPYGTTTNSQGYGAAAATANNEALGAALNAGNSGATTPTSYANPTGYNRLGIAVLNPATTAIDTTGNAMAPVTTTRATAPYISYNNGQGQVVYAQLNPQTGLYQPVDSSAINFAKTYAESNAYKTGNTFGDPNRLYLSNGTTSAYQNLEGNSNFNLGDYNNQITAAAQAQRNALASGYAKAASSTYASPSDSTATVNNNQNFIDQLSAQMSDINTAPGVEAADQTSANTQAAISSQLSTSGYQSGDLGAAARYGAGAAVGAEGAGALSHEQAAANAYDADFAQLGQAASQQLTLADNETQQQASADVQSIADEITNLQSQLGQLDTATANTVSQHLAALQSQIAQYQNAVSSYTGTAQQNATDFKTILSGVAAIGAFL